MNRGRFEFHEVTNFRDGYLRNLGVETSHILSSSIGILTSIEARMGDRGLESSTRNGCDLSVHNVAEDPAKERVHVVRLCTAVGSQDGSVE
jgi:hypothetical protein